MLGVLSDAVTDDDGLPAWSYVDGAPMPGGYRAWDRLGVGHRCETWLVWSPRLWCPAVLKLPRPHQVLHPRAVLSLERELSALHDNPHPVLPRLIDDGTRAPVPYLAVEYVDGPALDEEVSAAGALADVDVALLGVQLLTGVRALHRRGLAHVDVKPENVVLRDGRPVLVDFGSSRAIGTKQPAGHPVGTAGYAAPEMEACEPISAAMDVYSLGMTLREASTGERPELAVIVGSPVGAGPVPVRPSRPARGGRVADFVDTMCAPDPADRPTVDEALRLLVRTVPEDLSPVPPWALDAGASGDPLKL